MFDGQYDGGYNNPLTSYPAGCFGCVVGPHYVQVCIADDEAKYNAFDPLPEIPGAVSYDDETHGAMADVFRSVDWHEAVGYVDEDIHHDSNWADGWDE